MKIWVYAIAIHLCLVLNTYYFITQLRVVEEVCMEAGDRTDELWEEVFNARN